KAEWIQGTAPTAWEPDKVYVLECWATWCGPCIAAIPHVDALYDKYQARGLRVIGMDVFEEGKEKVVTFVQKKGDGMSYPVAYAGKSGAFENEWLKPAGVNAIPHAFIVKNGKVLLTMHPAKISEQLVEDLLAGGEAETKALGAIKENADKEKESARIRKAFSEASTKRDFPAMETAIANLKKFDPESQFIAVLELDFFLVKGDWHAIEAASAKLSNHPMRGMLLMVLATKILKASDVPESLRKSVADDLAECLQKKGDGFQYVSLVKLQWSLGEKESARATAKRAVDWAKTPAEKKPLPPAALFEKLAASLEKDELPTEQQTQAWLVEALSKKAPVEN
ncbi:MAG: TlpA disulfide reductase family protein, partial [Verrucomicrobiota bacterium]